MRKTNIRKVVFTTDPNGFQDFEVRSNFFQGQVYCIITWLHLLCQPTGYFIFHIFSSSLSTYHNIKQRCFKVVINNFIVKCTFELFIIKSLEVDKTISRNKTFYNQLTKEITLYMYTDMHGPGISLSVNLSTDYLITENYLSVYCSVSLL